MFLNVFNVFLFVAQVFSNADHYATPRTKEQAAFHRGSRSNRRVRSHPADLNRNTHSWPWPIWTLLSIPDKIRSWLLCIQAIKVKAQVCFMFVMFLCFYVLCRPTDCAAVFYECHCIPGWFTDWLHCIDLFSCTCIAASLFNKLTYLFKVGNSNLVWKQTDGRTWPIAVRCL